MVDQLYLMFFNLFFTSLPPLALGLSSLFILYFIPNYRILFFSGIYDQDASADMLISRPSLYVVGRESQLYRSHSFWVNVIDALYQSTVIFFVAYSVRILLSSDDGCRTDAILFCIHF